MTILTFVAHSYRNTNSIICSPSDDRYQYHFVLQHTTRWTSRASILVDVGTQYSVNYSLKSQRYAINLQGLDAEKYCASIGKGCVMCCCTKNHTVQFLIEHAGFECFSFIALSICRYMLSFYRHWIQKIYVNQFIQRYLWFVRFVVWNCIHLAYGWTNELC